MEDTKDQEVLRDRRAARALMVNRVKAAMLTLATKHEFIVTTGPFTCCNTCGTYDITQSNLSREPEFRAWAFAFWHQQSHEALWRGDSLYLNHGSFENSDIAATRAGTLLADALRNEGVKVVWDGDPAKKVQCIAFE